MGGVEAVLFARWVSEVDSKFDLLFKRSDENMSKFDELKAAVQSVSDAAVAERVEVQSKLDALSSQISDLASQLAEATSAAEVDQIVAELKGVADQVANVSEPIPAPAPEPTPVEPAPVDETPAPAPDPAPVGDTPVDPVSPPVTVAGQVM